ncbi:MAG: hypothetical protein M1812_000284 [Candelaria pacifica]|nr:MAG: hypothetical protein M1812_000284 [Candelaria pacifica]
MDDLSDLNWSSTSIGSNANKTASTTTALLYPSLRPTPPPPLSGRSTPQYIKPPNVQRTSLNGAQSASKPSTPVNDSFSNLTSFGSSRPSHHLSLQEQQKLLREQKAKQEEDRKRQLETQFGAHDTQFWDSLGGNNTSTAPISPPSYAGTDEYGGPRLSNSINKPFAALALQGSASANSPSGDDEDLFSAFNSAAPVDTSSHFPAPSASLSRSETASETHANAVGLDGKGPLDNDDDPFGLGQPRHKSVAQDTGVGGANDDDVLGLLGKPVSEFQKEPLAGRSPPSSKRPAIPVPEINDPTDRAVAELVDMGFPAQKAQQALARSGNGNDVQAAVGWLLNEAHQESKQKPRKDTKESEVQTANRASKDRSRSESSRRPRGSGEQDASLPAWMRNDSRPSSAPRRTDSRSPADGEKDVGQYASEIGTNLFKSANSLWKTSTKKVQKAVSEFQHENDSSQPKWMREVQLEAQGRGSQKPRIDDEPTEPDLDERRRKAHNGEVAAKEYRRQENITDEAMMLESGDSRPPPRRTQRKTDVDPRHITSSVNSSRNQSPAPFEDPVSRTASQPNPSNRPRPQDGGAKGRISRQAIEEQTSQAYISPARRKKVTPKPIELEPDLFRKSDLQPTGSPATRSPRPQSSNPFQQPQNPKPPSKPSTPLPIRRKAPPRHIPSISASGLSTSFSHRSKGTEAFKRGDYSAALTSYTNALSPLPSTHPVAIILLCNRALANLKVGEPKAAVADADGALSIIGTSRGEGEKINTGTGEPEKEMREFFGKALMRKAEALEQLEKWADAAQVWKEAVEAGVGGANSIQGRNRCEKAIGGNKQAPTSVAKRPSAPKKPPPKKTSALDELSGRPTLQTAPSAEAVTRLRAANAAAEKADDEKFALADSVDAKLTAWRAGRQDNLRALLGSLDSVLWPEAGWKKVGMHELVLANKVKVVYMKGIAKVHPDKLPTTATTEQKMISGAVFSTLNEAWDKFKRENGL